MVATIDLSDLEAEGHDDEEDRAERDEEAAPPETQLGDAALPGLVDRRDQGEAVGDDRRDCRRLEAVHFSARQRELGLRLAQRELLLTYLDAGVLQAQDQS